MKRTLPGSDGKAIVILDGWRMLQGSDGRMVDIPEGARALQGSDGRMVAIRKGYRGIQAVQDARARMCGKLGVIQQFIQTDAPSRPALTQALKSAFGRERTRTKWASEGINRRAVVCLAITLTRVLHSVRLPRHPQ